MSDGFLLLGVHAHVVDGLLQEVCLCGGGWGAAHGGDEVVGDVEVAAAAYPFAVGGAVGGLCRDAAWARAACPASWRSAV